MFIVILADLLLLLATRWDESLPITGSFIELVLEAMGFSEAQLPRGVALLFVAHAVPWLGGQRPRENP